MRTYYKGRAYLRRMRDLNSEAAAIRKEIKDRQPANEAQAGARRWNADTERDMMMAIRLEVIGKHLGDFYRAAALLPAGDRATALAYVETDTSQAAADRLYLAHRSFWRRMAMAAGNIEKYIGDIPTDEDIAEEITKRYGNYAG